MCWPIITEARRRDLEPLIYEIVSKLLEEGVTGNELCFIKDEVNRLLEDSTHGRNDTTPTNAHDTRGAEHSD